MGSDERRSQRRQSLRLNKIFVAEVKVDGRLARCYLYILDISEGGMKITTHFAFPPRAPVPARFLLDDSPLEVTVEQVWQKSIEGTQMMGLRFVDVSDAARAAIHRFMDRFSPQEKRRSFRLDRVLNVELNGVVYSTLDISTGGLRISGDAPLSESGPGRARLFLEHDRPPLELNVRVAWQKTTSFDRTFIGLEFVDPEPAAIERIDDFIDRALAGTLSDQINPELTRGAFE
ncbi:MAG: PilZ domain-containing protein, partial [Candidatus Xenobia bacterium]